MTAPLDLDALEQALARMTPIPWHAHKPCSPVAKQNRMESVGVNGPDCRIYRMARDYDCLPETFERQEADATGIVALRNAAPALLAAARERDELRRALRLTQEECGQRGQDAETVTLALACSRDDRAQLATGAEKAEDKS